MKITYRFLLAVLSGALLLFSFPPFDLEFLAWIALVPALIAIYYETDFKRVKWLGIIPMAVLLIPQWFEIWYSEMEFVLPASLSWLGYPIAIVVGFFLASLWGEILAMWKPARLPSSRLQFLPDWIWIIALPVLWVAVEFLLMSLPLLMKFTGAIGYTSLSSTQWKTPAVLQIASFTGMYGVTFLIVLVNSTIAYAIVHFRDYKWAYAPAVAAIVVLVSVSTLGWFSLPPPISGSLNAAIIQAPESYQKNPAIYDELVGKTLDYDTDIIMFGLTGTEGCVEYFSEIATTHHLSLLEGSELITEDGSRQHHDMPYHIIAITRGFVPWDPAEIISPSIEGFNTNFGKVGSLLCMESAFPTPTRKLVEGGTKLVTTVSGNKGFAMAGLLGSNAVYLAVEFGIPAVSYRAWGGSVIVDPYGRILEDVDPEEGIVAGKIPFNSEKTFYSQYGDIFGWTIVGLSILLIGSNTVLKRRRSFMYCEACGAEIDKRSETCQECGVSLVKPPWWKRILLHEYYEHKGYYKKPKNKK